MAQSSTINQPPTNFLKVCQVLHYICKETAPELESAIRSWHARQIQTGLLQCAGGMQAQPCPTKCKPKAKQNSCQNCIQWGSALEKVAFKSAVAWRNVDTSHLYTNPLEAANAFALHLPPGQSQTKIEDYDPASILKIMLGFGEFHQMNHGTGRYPDPYATINKVAVIRNTLAHSKLESDLHISDQEMMQYIQDIEDFITCLEDLHHLDVAKSMHIKTQLNQICTSAILFTSEMETALRDVLHGCATDMVSTMCDVLRGTVASIEKTVKDETLKIHQNIEESRQMHQRDIDMLMTEMVETKAHVKYIKAEFLTTKG
ncbi:uncharacterized protein [Amphiura filiformis]|uniref:uncharacterized protein n=1 Tax=Amphiura filiformis TaxID=82378 RepID=UPI003B220313